MKTDGVDVVKGATLREALGMLGVSRAWFFLRIRPHLVDGGWGRMVSEVDGIRLPEGHRFWLFDRRAIERWAEYLRRRQERVAAGEHPPKAEYEIGEDGLPVLDEA